MTELDKNFFFCGGGGGGMELLGSSPPCATLNLRCHCKKFGGIWFVHESFWHAIETIDVGFKFSGHQLFTLQFMITIICNARQSFVEP